MIKSKEMSLDVFMDKKSYPKESSEEIPTSLKLPMGWKLVKLGELAEFVTSGATPTVSDATLYSDEKNGIPFFRIQNISNSGLILSDLKYITSDVHNTLLKRSQVKPGDVLVTITGRLGTAVCVPPEIKNANINQHICLIRLNQRIVEPRYVAYHLNSEFSHEEMMRKQAGATRIALNHKTIRSLSIKLPPMEEQRRIVARIEEIMSRIEQAKKLREEALKDTEAIMQSALHQTFSKTEQKGWETRRLESIAFIRKGTINPTNYPEEEFELYSIPAYHTTGEPEIKKGSEIKSAKVIVYPGDCLFGKLNPHVQKVWLVKNQKNLRQIATTEFFPVVSKEKSNTEKWFLPEYIYHVFKSPNFYERVIKKVLGTTASRQRLSPNDILEEEIPTPSLEEQKSIVERLNKLDKKIKMLRQYQQEIKHKIEKATQVVLQKAFSGEL